MYSEEKAMIEEIKCLALLGQAVRDFSQRKELARLLAEVFIDILDDSIYHVVSIANAPKRGQSTYFYIFKKKKNNFTESELKTVIIIAGDFFGTKTEA